MIEHDSFDDPVLGRLNWDPERGEWEFTVSLSSGERVPGGITPESELLPLEAQGLAEIRRCIDWIRDNEKSIRAYIAERMFEGWQTGWYDEEIDEITTIENFRDAVRLSRISVLEDRSATLGYDDAGLFGGHSIVLTVSPSGQFLDNPQIWG